MKIEQRRGINLRRTGVVAGALLAATVSTGFAHPESAPAPGNTRTQGQSGDPLPFQTPRQADIPLSVTVFEAQPPLAGSLTMAAESPEPEALTRKQRRRIETRAELSEITSTMRSRPDMFKRQHFRNVRMYYPIYRGVTKKLNRDSKPNMDWYLLWIVHESETGASAGDRGFAPNSYYKGAMQRDPNFWPESFVRRAARGLKYLSYLPQRRRDDWREIAAGGKILDRNIDHSIRKGRGKQRAVHNALLLYSADWAAELRFKRYQKLSRVFD